MPGLDWTVRRPDFSDQNKYEGEGWEKIGKYDLSHRNGRFVPWENFGTADPLDKIGTVIEYQNESLGLKAITIDFFNQGAVYTEWLTLNNMTIGSPRGLALFINNRWVIKKLNEIFVLDVEINFANGRKIANKVRISFMEKQRPQERIAALSIVIARDD
ncbi:MAG: hypothetical protein HZB99_01890 [Candidatus Harrisonbacteria bacterium]|nr:hypothetical protein [Candidatus Harrisonbacteria bacterium]